MKRRMTVILLLVSICLAAGSAGNTVIAETIAAGDTVVFGRYEQDNNMENGPEPIEWIVLNVDDGKALLLSRYGLDARTYNTELAYTSWEQCDMRSWLNADFLNAAFTEAEQHAILTTPVDNSSEEDISGWTEGKDTQDQVFLLSHTEAFSTYFADEEARKCIPTDYAAAQGAWVSTDDQADGRNTGYWWLRTISHQARAATVGADGKQNRSHVCIPYHLVRPAIRVELSEIR